MTYMLLNIVFVLLVSIALGIKFKWPTKQTVIVAAVLLALTIVFDSLIVYFNIVEYAEDHILGFRLGFAPIEDYFYVLLAVLLVPVLWEKFGKKHDRNN